ncbi:alpha/beta hydrolase family protein [Arenicella xantha]|uniref:Putative alpha/beta hydrolase n=1 Tax=Arenicella xantha TaxID=644221 RepID=A0A395JL31_9GAMM|nr:alpha/beta fold hydrolase [Arenicella xantha]RBP48436.1 putative alpha/beta hydrolase [Arenicella xantha]
MPAPAARHLETIPFTADDGVSNALCLVKAHPTAKHTVLMMPAMGVPAHKYEPLMQALAQLGVTAGVFDLRGHGASSIRPSRKVDFSYSELVEHDLPAAINTIRHHTNNRPITLLGHSLGGQVSMLSLANSNIDINGIALVASCSVYYRGWPWPESWSILLFSQVCNLTAQLCGYFPGHRFRFGGNEARGVMRDWAHNARTGTYRLAHSKVDYEARLKQINIPVLAINFTDDKLAPASATQKLLEKLDQKSPQHCVILDGSMLGTKRADHFAFLRHPNKVAETVVNWLNPHG